jgi:transposase
VEAIVAFGFRRVDRDQAFLLPPDLREWLPDDHLARFVVEVVDQLDLGEIRAGYRLGGRGRQAYDPAMLVALLLYGYATGVRSSRRLERACHEDVACRFITANQQPDHATIARFRAHHQQALTGLFVQVLALAVTAGLVDPALVAVDSTKLASSASLAANVTADRLGELARQVFEEAAATDAAEDERYGPGRRGDEPADGWQAGPGRAAKIRAALDELEDTADTRQAARDAAQARRVAQGNKPLGRKRLPADPDKPGRLNSKAANRKVNLTDPQSRVMKTRHGYVQGYTGQAVAVEGQIIVAAEATNDQADNNTLSGLLALARRMLAAAGHHDPIGTLLADRGYWNTDEITTLEADNPELTLLVAPAGDRHLRGKPPPAVSDDSDLAAMTARMSQPTMRARYRRRSALIEPIFGHIKTNRRLDRLLRRGVQAANAEWSLICTAHNLTKLTRPA